MTPDQIHKLDQARATLTDLYPKLWAGLYKELLEEGLSAPEALAMVVAYIHATCTSVSGGSDG